MHPPPPFPTIRERLRETNFKKLNDRVQQFRDIINFLKFIMVFLEFSQAQQY